MSEAKLHDLPKGWIWSTIGEVCHESQYGWTTSGSSEGKVHLLRTTDITSGNIFWESVPYCKEVPPQKEKYLLRDGDIVISRAGSVGFSHLIKHPKEAVFASYLIRFRPLIEERYLSFYLKSPFYWDAISEKSIGIAIPNVNATKLKQIQIPIPPLPEQHRIVAKIEELFSDLDTGVEALKKAKAQLKLYRQAVLKAAFEGRLTAAWRGAHKGELKPATTLLKKEGAGTEKKITPIPNINELEFELPELWVLLNLGSCAELITKGESPKWQGFDYVEEGIIFIRSENVLWGKVNLSNPVKIPENFHKKLKRSQLKAGDVLINLVGASIGRCGLLPPFFGHGNINQAVAVIRANDALMPSYLMYLLNSPKIQKAIHSEAVEKPL